MKKRILSLVLCAAMLLSMCLFLGAGVMDDTTADGSAETTESYIPAVNFTNVAPFVQANAQAANGPARAPLRARSVTTLGQDGNTTDSDNDGLVMSKTAKDNGNGTYTITLEAFATGEVKVSSESKPCDIVLVLDRSTSMDSSFSSASTSYELVYKSELDQSETYYVKNPRGNYVEVKWCSTCVAWTNNCNDFILWHDAGTKYTPKASVDDQDDQNTQFYVRHTQAAMSRMQALHSAANNFITSVNSQSPDSRIAVVSFGQYGYIHTGNSNTALLDVSDNTQTIRDAINDVSADESATEHGKGLVEVNNIFSSYDSTGRNRVVVMITDGEPAPSGTDNWSSRTVKQAIENAYTLKNTYAASVYCISVMPGTDASNPTKDMDKYMSYVSSNYPDARYLGKSIDDTNNSGDTYYSGETSDIINQITPGNKVDTSKGSYYLTAGDISALNSIFDKISTQTGGSSVTLGSETVVRDVVTPYFTVPDEAAVSVKSYDCLSYNTATKTATWAANGTDISGAVNITGSTIDVSNFDFSHNFVAETGRLEGDTTKSGEFHGRKLVISFTVTPKAGFLGGNNVPTNGADSGVYTESGEQVKLFPQPEVNVPIKTGAFEDQTRNIYYGNTAPTLQDLSVSEPLASWQTAYVKISYNSDNDISNTQDGTYQVTMTVSPDKAKDTSAGAPAQEQTTIVTSTVNVYKPEITYRDSVINLGDTANYERDNFVSAVWKHGEQTSTDAGVIMVGTAPELTYTYTPKADKFTEDTYVNVTVMANGSALPDSVVKFHHNDCDFPGCSFDREQGEFIVHINVFDLTIQKTAKGGTTIDPNQTFVFKVKNNDTGKTMEIVITGEGQQTIKGLPMGSYTITEDTNWSWKYTPKSEDQFVTTSKIKNGAATVTFENENKGTNWLTSLAKAINTWAGGNAHEKTN